MLYIGIRLNTLCGLEKVAKFYYLFNYDVINIKTGKIKKISINNKGYPYVTLETKSKKKNKKVLMHHIIALAYICNKYYKYPEVIEHLDDNKLNYAITNLIFSNQFRNMKRMFENGHSNRVERIFEVCMKNGVIYIGTMKELSKKLNIPRGTLYDRFYTNKSGKKIKYIIEIKSTD